MATHRTAIADALDAADRLHNEGVAAPDCPDAQSSGTPADGVLEAGGQAGGGVAADSTGNGATPPADGGVGQLPDNVTMSDFRDMLRYARQSRDAQQRSLATVRSTRTVDDWYARICEGGLMSPASARLSPDQAMSLPVYRRLLRESLRVLHRELDEQALAYFVEEVTGCHQGTAAEVWRLHPDEFGQLLDGALGGAGPGGKGDANEGPPMEDAGAGRQRPDRREGGRPKLGEGPNVTPQEQALRNVYDLVRGAAQPGWGPRRLVRHFRENKDFKHRVKEAGKEFGEALFRAALAWIKENPDQETELGNVS